MGGEGLCGQSVVVPNRRPALSAVEPVDG